MMFDHRIREQQQLPLQIRSNRIDGTVSMLNYTVDSLSRYDGYCAVVADTGFLEESHHEIRQRKIL
ncbi:hypothetical protein GGR33_003474 [Methylobacterium brachythecii]|uniref:Uncharacterized protein n=1 Tax=Methylobacterium brachythecii TaxID=1176177 RepID=A0A7W6AMU6_9HYPH|nr:hypothetical protein [Methylobacterium brachythecii]